MFLAIYQMWYLSYKLPLNHINTVSTVHNEYYQRYPHRMLSLILHDQNWSPCVIYKYLILILDFS